MKYIKIIGLVLVLAIAACQSNKSSQDTANNPSYKQTLALVFADSSGVTEWHDAPLAQDAMSVVSLSNGDANGSCGNRIMLTNSGTQAASITVSTVYPYDESPWEMSQKYTVPAGATIHAGNDKICFEGTNTPFAFKIEGATYVTD